MHETQQCAHVVLAAGGQQQLLDDHQGVLAALPVLHDVVYAAGAAELAELAWGGERAVTKWADSKLCCSYVAPGRTSTFKVSILMKIHKFIIAENSRDHNNQATNHNI